MYLKQNVVSLRIILFVTLKQNVTCWEKESHAQPHHTNMMPRKYSHDILTLCTDGMVIRCLLRVLMDSFLLCVLAGSCGGTLAA